MRHNRSRVLLLGALVGMLVAGCSTSRAVEGGDLAAERIFGRGQVDQPALRIACGDYSAPAPSSPRLLVTVPVVIGSDGTVKQVGTPRVRASRPEDQHLIDRAVALALACVFEPAELDGRRVTVRDEVRFGLSRQGSA